MHRQSKHKQLSMAIATLWPVAHACFRSILFCFPRSEVSYSIMCERRIVYCTSLPIHNPSAAVAIFVKFVCDICRKIVIEKRVSLVLVPMLQYKAKVHAFSTKFVIRWITTFFIFTLPVDCTQYSTSLSVDLYLAIPAWNLRSAVAALE